MEDKDKILENFMNKKVVVVTKGRYELEGILDYNTSDYYEECKYRIINDDTKYTYYINVEDIVMIKIV